MIASPTCRPASMSCGDSYELALITNGASCLQREKLTAAGLDDYFDVVVISGEFGVGKPERSIFEHTLSLLGSDREHAVVIGDSLARDVDGAIAAGLSAVWVNCSGRSRPENRPGLVEIAKLSDLPGALQPLPS
jgi:putative hydrolase of the HAD superfamily